MAIVVYNIYHTKCFNSFLFFCFSNRLNCQRELPPESRQGLHRELLLEFQRRSRARSLQENPPKSPQLNQHMSLPISRPINQVQNRLVYHLPGLPQSHLKYLPVNQQINHRIHLRKKLTKKLVRLFYFNFII